MKAIRPTTADDILFIVIPASQVGRLVKKLFAFHHEPLARVVEGLAAAGEAKPAERKRGRTTRDDGLRPLDLMILRLLARAGRLSRFAIVRRLDIKDNSNLRERLSFLHNRKGFIKNDPEGYYLTTAGRALVEAEEMQPEEGGAA